MRLFITKLKIKRRFWRIQEEFNVAFLSRMIHARNIFFNDGYYSYTLLEYLNANFTTLTVLYCGLMVCAVVFQFEDILGWILKAA